MIENGGLNPKGNLQRTEIRREWLKITYNAHNIIFHCQEGKLLEVFVEDI